MKKILFLALLLLLPMQAKGTVYYVSTSSGDDANAGTSRSKPWRSPFKLNRTPFVAGDSILFKAGDIWIGADAAPIIPASSGSLGSPITWGAYSTGKNPVITAASRRNSNSDWIYEGNNVWSTGGVALTGSELFPNPNFSVDSTGWYDQCTGGGANCSFTGRTTLDGGNNIAPAFYEFAVVDHGSSEGNVQLYTSSASPLNFTQGRYYQVTFKAKSSTAFTIPDLLLRSDGADITSGMFVKALQVGTDWSTCTFMFRADRTTTTAGFNLLLGGSSGIPNGATLYVAAFSCKMIADQDFFGMYYSANLIFNFSSGGPVTGKLVPSGALANQGEWYQSPADRKIRLYSVYNPATFYHNDIIIVNGTPKSGFWVSGNNYHVFQYIDFFALPSAWNGQDFAHIIIQNCNAYYTGGIPGVDMHDYNWNGGSFGFRAGGGLGATGNISDWIFRYNNFSQSYDANVTWENGEWGGSGDNKIANGIWVYCNILGLAHYNIEFRWNGAGSSMSNVYIYNNTLYDTGSEWSVGQRPDEPVQTEDAHIKCWDSAANGTNINIENNIMDGAISQLLYFSDWTQWSSFLTMNNNIYNRKSAIFASVSGINYPTFGSWQTLSKQDTASLYADPLFMSRSNHDFHLDAGSPARSAGANVGLSTDFEGKTMPALHPDVGAIQYGVRRQFSPPTGLAPIVP